MNVEFARDPAPLNDIYEYSYDLLLRYSWPDAIQPGKPERRSHLQ